MRRIIGALVSIIITSLLFMPYCDVYAASDTVYSVKEGKKITLTTEMKKAVWGSDNTSVATVSKKGVVKGISAGTCNIVATADGKSQLFSVKVTKKKTKNKAIFEKQQYSYGIQFITNPVAYVDNKKITFFETTFQDLVEAFKDSEYTFSCDHGVNDIIASKLDVEIKKGSKTYAKIRLLANTSDLAKDALVYSVVITPSAPKSFYYFNKNYRWQNIPEYEDFKKSDLFTEGVAWAICEKKMDNKSVIECEIRHIGCPSVSALSAHCIQVYFDSETHKCVGITMQWHYDVYEI